MDAQISRRHTFWLPVGLFFASLPGCAALQQAQTQIPQFAQDATTIAAALGTMADAVSGVAGVPAALIASIKSGVAKVQSLAASIAASASSPVGSLSGTIGGFGSTVSGLLSSLGGLSLPSWVSTGLQAVSALLPTVLSVAGVVLAGPASPIPIGAARAYLAGLTR